MDKKEFNSRLLKLVVPITMQQLMLAAVSFTDALMVGFISQDALSAVSLAGQVQFIFSLFIFSVTGGVSILAAQYWGILDKDSVEKTLGIGMKLLTLFSLPFTVGALACPELIMKCFASDPVLIEIGAGYLRAVAPSYLMLAVSQNCLCIMKNCGRAVECSVISSASVVLNILFNWLLIFGVGPFPQLDAVGAAVATVISKAVELVWALIATSRKDGVRLRLKWCVHNDRALRRDYFKYSLPVLANNLVWGLGFSMYSVILGHLGSDAAAANAIANIIKNLAICVCEGVSSAAAVLVGSLLGQGLLDKAREYGSRLCKAAMISGAASGVIVLLVIPFVPLFGSLTDTAQHYLRIMLIVSSYYVFGKSINMTVISGIFPSGGDSTFGLKCDTVTMWAVTVPLGLIAAFVLKLPPIVVYVMINIDEIIKLPAVYRHYKKYRWIHNLTNTKPEALSA